jgi:hypothetical protein
LTSRQRGLGLTPATAAQAQATEHDRRHRDQDRHQRDVAEFEIALFDIGVAPPAPRAIAGGSPPSRAELVGRAGLLGDSEAG